VAKIEKPEACENLAAILSKAQGLMVARGDLGVEMGPEEVPMVQKRAIEAANACGKLVITATQMLDSMIRNPRPTRAEVSDVANAILDGSDAVMLSGETATGKHPVTAVETMARIIARTEQAERMWDEHPPDMELGHAANAMAGAAVASSRTLADTRAIITYTGSGGTARLMSDYRPKVPIFAFTPKLETFHSLALYWGVIPIRFEPSTEGDHILADIDRAVLERGILAAEDRVIIALGWPIHANKSVNMLKVHRIGEALRADS
jgi:pyruvate kinase